VARLPPEAAVLATNAHTPVQAFGIGRCVRAVQFHPELDTATMRALVLSRAPQLEVEARAHGEEPQARLRAILAGVRAAPHAARVLSNFVEAFT
jgi:GMP synthase (glutamine-hydrolysing)